jgi:hypothetical protein
LLWDDIASHLGILNVYTTHTGVLAQNYAQSACLPGLFQRPVKCNRLQMMFGTGRLGVN